MRFNCVIADVLADQVLAGVGAHVLVVSRDHHVRQSGCAYSARAFTSTVAAMLVPQ